MRHIWAGPEIGPAVLAWKFKPWIPLQDITFLAKEIPGPGTFTVWITGWQAFRFACLRMEHVTDAALVACQADIEK